MDITQLGDLLIKASKRSVRDFFETMCPVPLEEGVSFKEPSKDLNRDNYEAVGIISLEGQIKGSVAVYTKTKLINEIGQKMLKKASLATNELTDIIGEVTNIVAGSIKTWVSVNEGLNFEISCPSVIQGNPYLNITIQPDSSFIAQKFKAAHEDLLVVLSIHS